MQARKVNDCIGAVIDDQVGDNPILRSCQIKLDQSSTVGHVLANPGRQVVDDRNRVSP